MALGRFDVHAVDRDTDAIAWLSRTAHQVGLPLDAAVADLEIDGVELGEAAYDAILVFRYLHRPLFPVLARALRPGGVLVYETFTIGHAHNGKPMNPDFLLQPGELTRLVAPLEVLDSREGEFAAASPPRWSPGRRRASPFARRSGAAVRQPSHDSVTQCSDHDHSTRLTSPAAILALTSTAACGRASSPPPSPAGAAASGGQVVGRVEDRAITLEDVDKRALGLDAGMFQGTSLRQATYEARRRVLDEMVAEELFAREGKARGITSDALVQQEIMNKMAPIGDAEVAAWYQANQNRVQGAPLDQVREQIRQYLRQQEGSRVSVAFIDQLKTKMKVDVTLDPPRDDDGSPDAPAIGLSPPRSTLVTFGLPGANAARRRRSPGSRSPPATAIRCGSCFATSAADSSPGAESRRGVPAARCPASSGTTTTALREPAGVSDGDLKRYAQDLRLDAAGSARASTRARSRARCRRT
jgi:hypothetical protein